MKPNRRFFYANYSTMRGKMCVFHLRRRTCHAATDTFRTGEHRCKTHGRSSGNIFFHYEELTQFQTDLLGSPLPFASLQNKTGTSMQPLFLTRKGKLGFSTVTNCRHPSDHADKAIIWSDLPAPRNLTSPNGIFEISGRGVINSLQ